MATSGKRLNWQIIAGVVILVGVLVVVTTVSIGPGPAILMALPAGALMGAGFRASRNAPDDRTPPAAP
jgi:drug/metabolite transporter (DMT)-like permease